MSVRRSNLVEAVPQERRRAVPWALPANAAYFRVWLPRKKLVVTQSTCGSEPSVIVVLSCTIVHAVTHTVMRCTSAVLHTVRVLRVLIAKTP